MMKAYQIRIYEFTNGSHSTIERTVIALLTPGQRAEMHAWLHQQFGDRSKMVPYDLHNFVTAKEALLVPVENLVAGAIWPNAPQGTIPSFDSLCRSVDATRRNRERKKK